MKAILYFIPLLLSVGPLFGQPYAIFDFDDEVPEAVTDIFINLSFNKVKEIPTDIGRYKNLEELTLFPQSDFFLANNWQSSQHRIVDLEDTPINVIPAEIGLCENLRVLKIPEGTITTLPESIYDLKNLHTLQLPMGTTLDDLAADLLFMPALDTLECWLCPLSDANRKNLLAKNPDMLFIVSEDDIFKAVNTMPRYAVDINNNGRIVFHRRLEAEMFVLSIPDKERVYYNVTFKPE
jgi:hypothetical protein